MVSHQDADRLRATQQGIRALVVRDLEQMFGSLNLSRPEAAARAVKAYLPALVQSYGEQAAAVAADWYDEVRAKDGVGGRFRAVMADSPYLDAVDGTANRAVGGLFTDRPGDTLLALQSTAPKYILAAGRQTIVTSTERDPRGRGWQRVTSGAACGFCRMLAGRGGVYRESSVHFAAHKACGCAAVPSWDPNAPEVEVEVYQASARMSGLRAAAARGDADAARRVAEHNALIRRAIEQFP